MPQNMSVLIAQSTNSPCLTEPNAIHKPKMKIAYLTAGAAGMFCGSCLHDNALAKALNRLGHDCILIPAYTPIRTDDENVSIDRVVVGGINVYLQQKLPWLAYTPRWLDSFLNRSWIITPLTKNAGKTSPKLLGALAVSMLQGTQGRQRKEFHRLLDWLKADIQPDVLVFTNLLIGGGIPEVKRIGNTRVFVTLQGDDIFLDSLPTKFRTRAIELMQALVPWIDGFLIHSRQYAEKMASLLHIPQSKIHIIPLGIDTSGFCPTTSVAPASHASDQISSSSTQRIEFAIGYFARMAPEKGLHRLVDAFIAIAKNPIAKHARLKLAGWMGPQHSQFWEEQKRKLALAGLHDRWEYAGSVDRRDKARFLSSLDLFCVPTTYEEPKGLFLLEAVAAGVPYLQPSHGAFPEIHQRLHASYPSLRDSNRPAVFGELFQAGSMAALQSGLLKAIENHVPKPSAIREFSPPLEIIEEIDISRHATRVADALSQPTSVDLP